MQASARQRLPRRIKKEKMKRRIILRIALTTARLIPLPAQNSPTKIKVSAHSSGDVGLRRISSSSVSFITSDNICHIKSCIHYGSHAPRGKLYMSDYESVRNFSKNMPKSQDRIFTLLENSRSWQNVAENAKNPICERPRKSQ